MLSFPASVRVVGSRERVDFRKGIDGLYAVVRDHFRDDALSGHLYLFFVRCNETPSALTKSRDA